MSIKVVKQGREGKTKIRAKKPKTKCGCSCSCQCYCPPEYKAENTASSHAANQEMNR